MIALIDASLPAIPRALWLGRGGAAGHNVFHCAVSVSVQAISTRFVRNFQSEMIGKKMIAKADGKNGETKGILKRGIGRLLLLVLCASLLGCISTSPRFVTGLSPQDRELAAKLPVHTDRLPEGTYTLVGPVGGLSCRVDEDDVYQVSEEKAREELKRATFSVGADAVVGVQCQTYGRGEGPRSCFDSIECRGEAVRLAAAPEN
jgi:hypothetical protein